MVMKLINLSSLIKIGLYILNIIILISLYLILSTYLQFGWKYYYSNFQSWMSVYILLNIFLYPKIKYLLYINLLIIFVVILFLYVI